MFDVEFLGILIFFIVNLFNKFKSSKVFFFIVICIGALLGLVNYLIPLMFPAQIVEAAKNGIYIALGVSGLFGLAKKQMLPKE